MLGNETAPDGSPPRSPVGRTVLVVDDDATIRWLLADVLADMGASVLEASGCAEAVALLRTGTPDLLVTDLDLPGGADGRELVIAARAIHPELPVLFVTGHDGQALAPSHAANADTALLNKPFTAAALQREVGRLLGRSTCRDTD